MLQAVSKLLALSVPLFLHLLTGDSNICLCHKAVEEPKYPQTLQETTLITSAITLPAQVSLVTWLTVVGHYYIVPSPPCLADTFLAQEPPH